MLVPSLAVPLVLLLFTSLRFGIVSDKRAFALGAILLACLAALATWRLLPSIKKQAVKDCAGIYAAAGGLFIAIAMTYLFEDASLTVALTVLVVGIAVVWQQVAFRALWIFTLGIATVVLIRLTFNPFIFEYARTDLFGEHWVLFGFGLSALAFYQAAQFFRKSADDELVTALECGALVFAVLLVTYEVRILIEGSINVLNYGFLEQSVQSISWMTSSYGLMLRNAKTPRFFTRWGGRVLLCLASLQILLLQVLVSNPALTGERLKGFFPADSLFLAYLVPAVLLWFIVPKLAAIKFDKFAGYFTGFAAGLVFIYVTLETRHLFQGPYLSASHETNLELYITTLVWFALAGALLYFTLFNSKEMLVRAAIVIASLALFMVVAGHIGIFNPVLTGLPVPGVLIFNVLFLGFAVPAIALAIAARWSPGTSVEGYRDYLGIAAYGIGLVYVTLEVRRFFQGKFLDAGVVGDAEYYGYSLIWLIYALAALGAGMWLKRSMIRHVALAVLVLVVLKVFLSDMSGLGGLYRVASFMGLGLSLVGIGYLYQRYVFPVSAKDAEAETGQPGQKL